ncbi:MAG: dienelactone hydrolase [Chloroflexi bacterium RBG_16_54_11]|nr:MAG: dienelactone hydrolase [Chloroflexi bacterium RBG_16_54_11]
MNNPKTTPPQPDGYLALPPTGSGNGVLVLHAWWGLNDTIKSVCDRLAQSGFVAFAPDLYHGKVAHTIPEAEILGSAIDANHLQAEAETLEAVKYLSRRAGGSNPSVAVVAISLGGYYALHLSEVDPEHIRFVVLFYGTDGNVGGAYKNSRAEYLGHFAENDQFETPSIVDTLEQTLKSAGRRVIFYRYPGTKHWFFEPDRPDAYDPAAASLAWDRTLAFLKTSFASI